MNNNFKLFSSFDFRSIKINLLDRINDVGDGYEYCLQAGSDSLDINKTPLTSVPEIATVQNLLIENGFITRKSNICGFGASCDDSNIHKSGYFSKALAERALLENILENGPSKYTDYKYFEVDKNGSEFPVGSNLTMLTCETGIRELLVLALEGMNEDIKLRVEIISTYHDDIADHGIQLTRENLNNGVAQKGLLGLSILGSLILANKPNIAIKTIQSGLIDFEKTSKFHFCDYEIAAQDGHSNIISALSDAGAPVKTINGKFPAVKIARSNGYPETADLLLSVQAKSEVQNMLGEIFSNKPKI